ncbi:MAG: hypothetical protein WA708_01835 [Acidobacteriaceae bacterium]
MNHPNVHAAWSSWSEEQTLHVVAPYINPFRYRARRELFHDFRLHLGASANVRLHIVEVAFGDRPFEVSTPDDVQLRTGDALWLKENAINVAIQRLPADWKYAAYVDGDFHFTRHDWALEAIHKLQHSSWVQLFSGYALLDAARRPMQQRPGFAYAYHNYFGGKPSVHRERFGATDLATAGNYGGAGISSPGRTQIRNTTPGATGGAWAFTREGFSATGGLLDTCVLGAADWYMAFGLVGNTVDGHPEAVSCGAAYENSIRRWQERAFTAVRGNIGYVDNYCTHGWHGDHRNRGYGERWKILRDHGFDPLLDVRRDWQGLLAWSGNKPEMEADVNRYFLGRDEDATESTMPALF